MTVLRVATGVMLLVFVLSAAVQYNDPDPIRWIAIYGAAAVACFHFLRGKRTARLPLLTGLVAVVWAATLVPRVAGAVAPGELFREAGMATLKIEEAREMIGLLIVAVWMLVLYVAGRRTAR